MVRRDAARLFRHFGLDPSLYVPMHQPSLVPVRQSVAPAVAESVSKPVAAGRSR